MQKYRHFYRREDVTKGYGRGQRLQPRRWWCRLVEVPGLRQTGWSSVTSAGTVTPPSRDCVPSGHVTPVMIITIMLKKQSQYKVSAWLYHQPDILQIYAAFQCKGCNIAKAVPCVRTPDLPIGLLSFTTTHYGPLRIHKSATECDLAGLQHSPWRMEPLTWGVATTCFDGRTKSDWGLYCHLVVQDGTLRFTRFIITIKTYKATQHMYSALAKFTT